MDPTQVAQMNRYLPWLIIAGVVGLFLLLRLTRKGLRRRVDEIGYRLRGERGLMIWFWLNAPGVMLHELSHAFVVLFFYPFGFRITSITLFRIKPKMQQNSRGQLMRHNGRLSLQLGEVQYVRPQGQLMSYIGDGFSAIAPLFGGILAFVGLYWVATGYTLWHAWQQADQLQFLRPGWPWWTLLFTPYLMLTVTSELWPSSQDWKGARWLMAGLLVLGVLLIIVLYVSSLLIFNHELLLSVASFSAAINFVLLVLLGLDIV